MIEWVCVVKVMMVKGSVECGINMDTDSLESCGVGWGGGHNPAPWQLGCHYSINLLTHDTSVGVL